MDRSDDDLKALIRTIPDFPRPGIQFRDITTLLLDGAGFATAIERLASRIEARPDIVAAIEARGFVIGAAMAQRLGTGLLLVRKHGKLPGETIAEEYALEYGTDRLAMHVDACAPGASILLVDDLIATGGTALAAARLIRRAGGTLMAAAFVIDLPDLGGAQLLREQAIPVHSLVSYAGE
jgi:adenine phosphoribosyltransferase